MADFQTDYRAYQNREAERRNAISHNAAQRLARNPQPLVDVPAKLPRPMAVEVLRADGSYVGAYPYGWSKADALKDAAEHGETGKLRARVVPALR